MTFKGTNGSTFAKGKGVKKAKASGTDTAFPDPFPSRVPFRPRSVLIHSSTVSSPARVSGFSPFSAICEAGSAASSGSTLLRVGGRSG